MIVTEDPSENMEQQFQIFWLLTVPSGLQHPAQIKLPPNPKGLKAILGALRGAPNLQKWTSDDFPVNICQLDYYVVFGAQSGLLQDLERGK